VRTSLRLLLALWAFVALAAPLRAGDQEIPAPPPPLEEGGLEPLPLEAFGPDEAAPPAGDRLHDLPAPPTAGALTLVVLHTNDLHGQAYPQKALWLKRDEPPMAGGFSALASLIRRERAAAVSQGAAVLVVDAGDIWQGTPEGDRTEGRLALDWLAVAGYDALTLGEHDFDLGAEAVAPLFARAQVPVLAANLVVQATRAPPTFTRPALDRVLGNGLRVSVIGVMPSDMKLVSSPRTTRGYDWNDALEAAREGARAARARGAEVVLLLSHCGAEADRRMAGVLEGVDAIVGGRTHEGIDPAWTHPETGVLVAATWSKGSTLGRIELVYDRALLACAERRGRLLPVRTDDLPRDVATEALLSKEAAAIHEAMSVTLGAAEADIMRERGHASSPLGSWLADLMRAATGADVALHNKAGLRADLARGPIRRSDVYQVSPFSNTLVTMRLTGEDLRDALEHALTEPRLALEVSGVEARYDLERPHGERLVRLRVAGAPLDPARLYTVVVNSFLSKGGDGHAALARGRDVTPTGRELLKLHEDDIARRKSVAPLADRRFAPAETTLPSTIPGG